MKWVKMNIEELITLTETFDYVPNISIKYPEISYHQFYRIPKYVHLGQLPDKTWVEVVYFGPLNINFCRDLLLSC